MTSKDTGASEHALIDLIYRHLKENGFKKAASALKKHAPQVETTNVKVSLDDIFKKWISEDQEKKGDEGKYLLTSSVSKPHSAVNAAHTTSPEKKVKSQTPSAARNQKSKRAEKKTCKSLSVVEGQTTEHSPTTGEDSDSDSSLDVEKWKRLAMQLSDADIAKIDAFTNVSTSTAKSTKRKPAQPKKRKDQTIGNGKSSPKTTKVKTTTSPKKTPKSKEVKTPSNKPFLAGISNGLDKVKVKRKKKHSVSESHDIEPPSKKAETEKTDDISEPKPSDTPCKKTKSKKDIKVARPGSLETPSKVTNPEVASSAEMSESNDSRPSESVLHSETGETKAKKHKSKKVKIVAPVGEDTYIQSDTEDATASLTSDQSKINQGSDINPETPSKKVKSKKSKKSKEHQEPEDTLPCGERQIEDRKSLLETEKPSRKIESQAVTSILEQLSSDTPSKTSKTKKGSETDRVDSPSKKAVVDVGQDEAMLFSSSNPGSMKKSKRKRTDTSGENMTSSVTEHVSKSSECDSSGVGNSLLSTGNSTENEGQGSVSALGEEGSPEPKKRKKNKKDKEKKKNESDENVEEVPSTPQAEEFSDYLSSSHKKKKKKKQKHGEEEMPSLSPPLEDTPKKKKKSSKEKENADVSVQV